MDRIKESPEAQDLNVAELRKILQDYFNYKPWFYWTDFLFNISATWISFLYWQVYPGFSWIHAAVFLVTVFCGYRSVLFIHEISHFKTNSVPYFTVVWNLICGIPFFVPSFMYRGVHNDHHSKLFYGTKDDGEYVPFGAESPKRIFYYLATTFISPILLPLRFAILAPLSAIIPSFRKIVVTQLSSLVIDFEYVRPMPNESEARDWRWQEAITAGWGIFLIIMFISGRIPLRTLGYLYCMMFSIFLVNSIRTIAAHRYKNTSDPISMRDQFLDSVNVVSKSWIAKLVCPVGLRFHALHHLFPTMPYHSLPSAHEKLVKLLPSSSEYHLVNEASLASAFMTLWHCARSHTNLQGKDRVSLVPLFLQKKSQESEPEKENRMAQS